MSELLKLYTASPESERAALDQVIADQGINDLESLVDAVDLVTTYFAEQPGKVSFEQFRKSRKLIIWDRQRCMAEGFNDIEKRVYCYMDTESIVEDGRYIEIDDGIYKLQITADGVTERFWSDNLESLEQRLYKLF